MWSVESEVAALQGVTSVMGAEGLRIQGTPPQLKLSAIEDFLSLVFLEG